jgi:hypothetical protein
MTPEELLGVPSWPWGYADEPTALAYAATQPYTVTNNMTILNFATLTGNTTLNLTINPDLRDGAVLFLSIPATANGDNLALGSGIVGPAIVGVAGKIKNQTFILVGGIFTPMADPFQID